MSVDPNISLQVQAPNIPSPISTVGQIMNIRDMASQVGLRNAQTQQALQQTQSVAAEAQKRQRLLQGETDLQRMYQDPALAGQFAQGKFDAAYGKVPEEVIDTHRQHMLDARGKLITQDTSELTNRQAHATNIQNFLSSLISEQTPDDKVADYSASGLQTLKNNGDLKYINMPIPDRFANKDEARKYAAAANVYGGVLKAALTEKEDLLKAPKTQSEIDAAKAKVGLELAQTPGAQAESERQQMSLDLMKKAIADPSQGGNLIDQAIPSSMDPALNQSYKAAWQAAMSSGSKDAAQNAAAVVKAAADHASQISMKINPIVRAGEAATAGAKAAAEVPAHVSSAIQIENATAPLKMGIAIAQAKALRQGDNPAVAGVAPAAVGQVQNQAIKLDEAYAKAKASADSFTGRRRQQSRWR